MISVISYFNVGGSSSSLDNNGAAKVLSQRRPVEPMEIIPSDASMASEYYKADGHDDLIASMPNLDTSTCSDSTRNCEFAQYSGYLLANNNAEIHYWFIEADVDEDVDVTTLPVFVWTNGGPGCSGMDGLLTEHGPWRVQDDLRITYNKYAWTTEVNMLYLEQPYGVGFSAANDMDAAVRNFLTKFPEYADADIYTTAESWGGHYVPMTASTILKNNAEGVEPKINFRGFLLGNPYTDWYENTYGFVGDVFGHGLMSSVDWDKWHALCWDNEDNVDSMALCSAIYTRAYLSSYNSNVYALDWPQCLFDEDWSMPSTTSRPSFEFQKGSHLHRHARRAMSKVLEHKNYDELNMRVSKKKLNEMYTRIKERKYEWKRPEKKEKLTVHAELEPYYAISTDSYVPCIEYNMADWLNLEEVQTALNVKSTEWEMCSDAVWDRWPDSDYDLFMQDYYDEIIQNYAVEEDLKLCVYSGDDDSVCGIQGTQYWLDRWEGYEADSTVNWTPWADESLELGGYYTIYHKEGDDSFNALHFMSVRTAGHMVPTTEPARALTLLKKYLYEMTTTNQDPINKK